MKTCKYNVIMKPINELRPYQNNPRHNDNAVEAVAASIKEFGFRKPIEIDADNVIVNGHTRLKAAKLLGYKNVPCIDVSDLSPEQIKAYRLADNKTGELATWDDEKLKIELEELASFKMPDFGFEYEIPEFTLTSDASENVASNSVENNENEPDEKDSSDEGRYYGDARERTADIYLLRDFDEYRTDGKYQMPVIEPTKYIPNRLIGFNYMLSSDEFDVGIHFYLDDYQFERIWNNPRKYVDRLAQFDCVLSPDFSLYMNMPMAMKIWNVYRSRLIGQILQDYGCKVIPTLSWAEEETFEFCFDGLREGGVVSVSTIGVKHNKDAMRIWEAGMNEAIKRLKPSGILVYGGDIGYDFGSITVKHFENEVTKRWKEKA